MGDHLDCRRLYRLHVVADLDFLFLELLMHAEDEEHDAQLKGDRHADGDGERPRRRVALTARGHVLVHGSLHEHIEESDDGGKHLPEIRPNAAKDAEACQAIVEPGWMMNRFRSGLKWLEALRL